MLRYKNIKLTINVLAMKRILVTCETCNARRRIKPKHIIGEILDQNKVFTQCRYCKERIIIIKSDLNLIFAKHMKDFEKHFW